MTSVTFYFNSSKRANITKKRPNKRDKVWLISFISHSTFVSKGQGESILRCCGSFSFQELGNIFTPTQNKLSYSFELMTKTTKSRSADSES